MAGAQNRITKLNICYWKNDNKAEHMTFAQGQRCVRSLNSCSQKKEGKEKKEIKIKIKDRKVLSSELWGEKKDRKGIQRNTINKTFNIRKGLSSVFGLILSVLILSDIHIAVTSALWQCTRGFNFSLSCKKFESIGGQLFSWKSRV